MVKSTERSSIVESREFFEHDSFAALSVVATPVHLLVGEKLKESLTTASDCFGKAGAMSSVKSSIGVEAPAES